MVSAPVLAGTPSGKAGLPPFHYGKMESMEDIRSKEGLVVLRLALEKRPEAEAASLSEKVRSEMPAWSDPKPIFSNLMRAMIPKAWSWMLP